MKLKRNRLGKFIKDSVKTPRPKYKQLHAEAQKTIRTMSIVFTIILTITGIALLGQSMRLKEAQKKIEEYQNREISIAEQTALAMDMTDYYKHLTYSNAKTLEEKIYEVFGEDASEALKIANCESSLRPDAQNPNSSATGVFQILSHTHGIAKKWLLDPDINIAVAKSIFDAQGATPWMASNHCHKLL